LFVALWFRLFGSFWFIVSLPCLKCFAVQFRFISEKRHSRSSVKAKVEGENYHRKIFISG